MRVLLVDDEPWARQALHTGLKLIEGVDIVGDAANAIEALELIAALQPDLVLLDIEMPGLTGLEMLAQLPDGLPRQPLVIFVTAYSEYAVDAFEANALDYLLKPIRQERLAAAIDRAKERLAEKPPPGLDTLLRQVRPIRKVAVKQGKRVLLLHRADLLYARMEDELLAVYAVGTRYTVDRTLTQLEDLLEGGGFFRISRASLVNLDAVTEMYPWLASGTWRVKLTDGTELDVSRERAKALKDLVGL